MPSDQSKLGDKPRAKQARQWQATVELTRGAAIEDSPAFIVNHLGKTLATDDLNSIDLVALLPARTFVASRKKRNRPTRPYLYNRGHHIVVESETEGIEAHLLDRDPTVEQIVPQGVWVKCSIASLAERESPPRWGWYCADFLIRRPSGQLTAIEVKRNGLTFRPSPVSKLLAAADACRQHDLDFEIRAGLNRLEGMTFRQLHHGRRARYLTHHSHSQLRAAMSDAVSNGPRSFAELRSLGDPTVTATLIWEQIWHGILCLDWNRPIELSTPIRLHSPACADAGETSAWDFKCGPRRVDLLAEMQGWAASL